MPEEEYELTSAGRAYARGFGRSYESALEDFHKVSKEKQERLIRNGMIRKKKK